jgi:type II secretory pathway pseudopilin PulG
VYFLRKIIFGRESKKWVNATCRSGQTNLLLVMAVLAFLILSAVVGLGQVSLQSAGARKTTTTTSLATSSISTTTTTASSISSSTTLAGTSNTFEEPVATQNSQQYYSQDVSQTSDGGYVLAADNIALIVKLDSTGNLQWQKQYAVKG